MGLLANADTLKHLHIVCNIIHGFGSNRESVSKTKYYVN